MSVLVHPADGARRFAAGGDIKSRNAPAVAPIRLSDLRNVSRQARDGVGCVFRAKPCRREFLRYVNGMQSYVD